MTNTKGPFKSDSQNMERSGVDTCWHVPIIAALAMLTASIGKQNSGFFYVGLMELFGVDRSVASWPNSVTFVLKNLSVGATLQQSSQSGAENLTRGLQAKLGDARSTRSCDTLATFNWLGDIRIVSCGAMQSENEVYELQGIFLWILMLRFSPYQITLIGSVLTWAGVIASAFAPSMSWTTATLGAIYGAGVGIFTLSIAYINVLYFDRYRGIACGMKFAGAYMASLLFPPALVYLEEAYGFRGALLLSGAVTMHATLFAIPLNVPIWMRKKQIKLPRDPAADRIPPNENGSLALNSSKGIASKVVQSLRESVKILRMPVYYLIVAYAVISDLTAMAFQSTIVDYTRDKGFTLKTAEYVVVYSSAAQLVGCLIVPLVADCGFMRRSTLITANLFVFGSSLLILPHVTSHPYIVTTCFFVAMSSAFLTAIKAAIISDYLGADAIPVVFTVMGLTTLPLFLCNPGIIGVFRDSMGSYDNYYRLHGGLQLFAGVIFSGVFYIDRHRFESWSLK